MNKVKENESPEIDCEALLVAWADVEGGLFSVCREPWARGEQYSAVFDIFPEEVFETRGSSREEACRKLAKSYAAYHDTTVEELAVRIDLRSGQSRKRAV